MPNTLLTLDQINVNFGPKRVLEGLSFSLQAGEIGCLLGASGCGKTTALRAIAGFEPVAAGRVILDGQQVASPGQEWTPQQRGIGMVFQDYALFPHLNVTDNIRFGLSRLDKVEQKRRVEELLEVVQLTEVANAYPHALSGGQQQRVALARALAPAPRLLLLDEPFSNLDVELRERLNQEVRDILKSRDITALLVTHDQHEAFSLADKVGVMHAGRLLQWDTPYKLYHEPAERFVADFIGEGVFLPAVVTAAGDIEFSADPQLGHRPCWPVCQARPGQAVQVLLRPDDILHDDTSPMQARVVKKAFRGAQFLYTLSLPSGQTVLSLVPSHHDHAIGEAIGIRLEIDHVIAFGV